MASNSEGQNIGRRKTRSSTKANETSRTVIHEEPIAPEDQEETYPTIQGPKQTGRSSTDLRLHLYIPTHHLPRLHHPFQRQSTSTGERRGAAGTPSLIFTHGAGGSLSNPATSLFADGFADVSPVVSFQGTMNLASRVANFQAVLDHEDPRTKIVLGGRSMGARAAVMLASRVPERVNAVVLASYPLVGAQKGDVRDEILVELPGGVDVLFICGSEDAMCDLGMLRDVVERMQARCWIVEVVGADHGMGLRGKAGVEVVRRRVGKLAAKWLEERYEGKRYMTLSWDSEEGEVTSPGWQS